jgi:hypothetical protein
MKKNWQVVDTDITAANFKADPLQFLIEKWTMSGDIVQREWKFGANQLIKS